MNEHPCTLNLASQNSFPLVSILIPSCKARWFKEVLDSALAQDYPRLEVMVYDNCPTEEIRQICTQYPQIRYWRNSNTHTQNIIDIAKASKGRYIKYLFNDDLLEPDCVSQMVNAIMQDQKIRMVFSRSGIINEARERKQHWQEFSSHKKITLIDGNVLCKKIASTCSNCIGEFSSVLLDGQWLRSNPERLYIGGKTGTEFRGLLDVICYMNASANRPVAFVDDTLASFRSSTKSNRNLETNPNFMDCIRDWKLVIEEGKALGLLDAEEVLSAKTEYNRSTHLLTNQYPRLAEKILSLLYSPDVFDGFSEYHHQIDDSLSRYATWQQQKSIGGLDERDHRNRIQKFWKKRFLFELILILKPGAEERLADTINSLAQQYYDGWRLSIFSHTPPPDPQFLSEESPVRWVHVSTESALPTAINEHLACSSADWIGFSECGTQFDPALFLNLGHYSAIRPDWALIYTDEDRIEGTLFVDAKRSNPLFKPDFNLDLLRSLDYVGDVWVVREKFLLSGGMLACPRAEKYDLLLRVVDTFGEKAIGHLQNVLSHVPEAAFRRAENDGAILALASHLNRQKIHASIHAGLIPGISRRLVYKHPDSPNVSIIIPNKNRLSLLAPCIESLLKHTTYPHWELLIVDNGSTEQEVFNYYKALTQALPDRVRILAYPGEFNYSAMNNVAAQKANSDYLLLLNNDTVCIHDDWLEAMMSHAQRADVGIVGARLLLPDSLKIQHAGVIIGLGGYNTAGHVFYNEDSDQPGYMGCALVDQAYSAVTAACLLVRKEVFQKVGGFNEKALKVNYNDVDLCLKVGELGLRIIWTPFATLLHYESASRKGQKETFVVNKPDDYFCATWEKKLACDPAWSQNRSLSAWPIGIEGEFVSSWDTSFHDRPRLLTLPDANWAVADYRQLSPLRALHTQGRIHYTTVCQPKQVQTNRRLTHVDLLRMAPDTLFTHAPVDELRCIALSQAKHDTPDIFRLYSLDELITDLPKNNPPYQGLSADMIKERLEIGLKASDRLIVSTEPLKEAYRHLIDDIRVIPNALDPALWRGVSSTPRHGKKLRVGWVEEHAGDWPFILDVIKATYREVDWVFFGSMSNSAKPFLAEFHAPAHQLADYPTKLASLDLDLAIAPLEIHRFNEAKSNLRLLEYGILGWPVLCSDILPYQINNPPVTRLANATDQWIAAIFERINEPKTLAKEGLALQKWVKKEYLLDRYLDAWFSALVG